MTTDQIEAHLAISQMALALQRGIAEQTLRDFDIPEYNPANDPSVFLEPLVLPPFELVPNEAKGQ